MFTVHAVQPLNLKPVEKFGQEHLHILQQVVVHVEEVFVGEVEDLPWDVVITEVPD